MPVAQVMEGPRLEFALVSCKEPVKRKQHSWDPKKKKLVEKEVVRDDCYDLYLPSGQYYRLTAVEAQEQGYMRKPEILNFDSIKDRNSNPGKFKFGMNDTERQEGYQGMIKDLIKFCTKGGRVPMEKVE